MTGLRHSLEVVEPAAAAAQGSGLFDAVFAACPWPMLMLSPAGQVLAASDHGDGGLASRLPLYLAALKAPLPCDAAREAWCERFAADGTPTCERLFLRPAPWGASLTVVPAAEPPPAADAQTARLAALGFMVAGVCHEIANPLTSLHSIVQILRADRLRTPDLLDKGLANIAGNVQRILDISRRLVRFARVGDEQRAPFVLDDAVDEALVVLRQDGLLAGIDVQRQASPRARAVGNIGQAREVLLNLLINAAHAMEGRGALQLHTQQLGDRVAVCVADSGPGVPAALRERIFEPFFTTKPEGRGTGLGLAISREIALEHGGALELLPPGTGGAVFRFVLPAAP